MSSVCPTLSWRGRSAAGYVGVFVTPKGLPVFNIYLLIPDGTTVKTQKYILVENNLDI